MVKKMKVVDKLEDVFYGAGIVKTHAISETKFNKYTLCGGDLAKGKMTVCGYIINRLNKTEVRKKDFTLEEVKKIVDCKNCLKKLEKGELENVNAN